MKSGFRRRKPSDLIGLLSGRNVEIRTYEEETASGSFKKLEEETYEFIKLHQLQTLSKNHQICMFYFFQSSPLTEHTSFCILMRLALKVRLIFKLLSFEKIDGIFCVHLWKVDSKLMNQQLCEGKKAQKQKEVKIERIADQVEQEAEESELNLESQIVIILGFIIKNLF